MALRKFNIPMEQYIEEHSCMAKKMDKVNMNLTINPIVACGRIIRSTEKGSIAIIRSEKHIVDCFKMIRCMDMGNSRDGIILIRDSLKMASNKDKEFR
jgi:hypothetical protein